MDKDLIRRKYTASVRLFGTDLIDGHFGAGTVPDDPRVLAHSLEMLVRRAVMRATAPARAKQSIIGSAPAQAPKAKAVPEKDSSDDDDDDSDVDDAEAGTLNRKARRSPGTTTTPRIATRRRRRRPHR